MMPTLWPFCPTDTHRESLAWTTDVIRPYSTEQRIRLSDVPRRTFAFDHAMNARAYERAKLLAQAVGGGSWYLPLWHERQRFTCLIGATTLVVDTTSCEYVAGGYACLWTDDETCEVVTIDSVASGSITLTSGASRAYTDALIMPAVVAYNTAGFESSRTVSPIAALSAEWSVYEGTDLGALGYTTYRGYPAMTDSPRIGSGAMGERFGWSLDTVDNGLAAPYLDSMISTISRSLSLAWMPATLSTLRDLREFFHYVKGRQKAFWIPDWTKGLTLTADIAPGSTTISVRTVGLNTTAETGDIMILHGNTQTRLQYTNVSVSGASEVLTLSGTAGITLAAGDEDRVCLLRLCRLAQDRVEIAYQARGRDRQIARVQVLADEAPIP